VVYLVRAISESLPCCSGYRRVITARLVAVKELETLFEASAEVCARVSTSLAPPGELLACLIL